MGFSGSCDGGFGLYGGGLVWYGGGGGLVWCGGDGGGGGGSVLHLLKVVILDMGIGM